MSKAIGRIRLKWFSCETDGITNEVFHTSELSNNDSHSFLKTETRSEMTS